MSEEGEEEKQEEEQQERPVVKKKKKQQTFKLCFAAQNLAGRSNIQIGKPLKLGTFLSQYHFKSIWEYINNVLTTPTANTITPKFYCKHDTEQSCSESTLKKQIEYLDVKGPREKYEDPVTENQRYGWYQVRFTDMDWSDRRLHFAKQANPFVKEHLMNYENIR